MIFPAPYWVSPIPRWSSSCGARAGTRSAEDGSFYPRIEDIERVTGSYTKAVIINSPNNPSGAVYSADFIKDVVEFCEKRGLYLIMDDIYHRLIFDGKKPVNCYEYAKDRSDNSKLILINGVSKQYAMTGFRIGWAVANKADRGHDQHPGPRDLGSRRLCCSTPRSAPSTASSRRSTTCALTLENNRNVLVEQLRSFDGVRTRGAPDGTFYSFPDFSHYDKDSIRSCRSSFSRRCRW